ncbi:MAG TPA: trypsin-like peptidase domain-containing protein [Candidatus Krumholzibacteria bacterium]|nr:trypsin-like peptidase domain-containing protein [Candidatus Krumholzibacteria bacterium]
MRRAVLIMMLVLLTAPLARAAVPASLDLPAAAVADLPPVLFAMPDRAELDDQDKAAAEAGEPYRFAVPFETALTTRTAGRWSVAAGGARAAWRLRVAVPGALSLNLAFVTCNLPPSAELVMRPVRGGRALRFAADQLDGDALWTPVLLADDLVVEVTVDAAERGRVALELARVNAGYRYFGEDPAAKSGTCNVDVVCPEGDDWRDEIRSVGVYQIGGIWKCSGAMINNTALDARPLFLTAAHCGVTLDNDATVVAYWNFESPACGQQGGGSLADTQTGATMLAKWFYTVGSLSSDLCLLEFTDQPDASWGVTYAGWNRADAVPSASVTIHHPSTDEKSISFDNDPATITDYLGTATPGNGTHLRIGAWDLGTTEGGSSGSPLFDPQHRIVGQLHGGYASCTQPAASDWYGRLFRSWEGNGTVDTRLRDWLDPGNTGAVTLGLLDPAGGVLQVTVPADLAFGGSLGGPFTPAGRTVTLANGGAAALNWSATAGAAWFSVNPAVGYLDAGASVDLTVATTAAAADLVAGVHTAALDFASDGGGETTSLPVTISVAGGAPSLVSVGPNPFRGYCTITYELGAAAPAHVRVYDLRGRMAADLGAFAGEPGANTVTWDGRDGAGRRQPGGRYVLEIEVAGHRLRAHLTLAH